MPVRRVYDDERVKENAGRVAVMRGPIVYCAEEIDISDLMRICETENRRQLISMLGFISD